MKKFIAGILFGVLLTIGTTAYADGILNMVGKTVDGVFSVFVDGKPLSTPAIVIEGTSYAPVRAVGEALGLGVGFDGQKITLEAPKPSTAMTNNTTTDEVLNALNSTKATTATEVTPKVESTISKDEQLGILNSEIGRLEIEISGLQTGLRKKPDSPNAGMWQQLISDDQAKLQQLQQQKAALEAQQ